MATVIDWNLYEQEKKRIDETAQSADEYEKMIKDLIERLNI